MCSEMLAEGKIDEVERLDSSTSSFDLVAWEVERMVEVHQGLPTARRFSIRQP